jgi:hypothetical protein
MRILQLMTWSAAALCVSLSVAHAGSCSDDIDRMQARIDGTVEAIAAAGPFVPPGVSAGMGVQPTPFGIATVEEKMGEVSTNKVDAIRAAMAQAHAASSAGNYKTCEQALAQVRRLMHP